MELVYTVCGHEDEAGKIARDLVESELAACCNYWKISSIYSWKGEVKSDGEVAMIVKTTEDNIKTVMDRIKELHSYDVPAVFSVPVDLVDNDYMQWLVASTE